VIIFARMSPAYTRNESRSIDPAERHSGTVRKPSDWHVCGTASLVRHGPTRTVYHIHTRPGLPGNGYLTLEDFYPRLVHVCEGAPRPCGAVLEVLRREAVLMGLHFLGLVVRDDETSNAHANE
jgi:hypothetical protein